MKFLLIAGLLLFLLLVSAVVWGWISLHQYVHSEQFKKDLRAEFNAPIDYESVQFNLLNGITFHQFTVPYPDTHPELNSTPLVSADSLDAAFSWKVDWTNNRWTIDHVDIHDLEVHLRTDSHGKSIFPYHLPLANTTENTASSDTQDSQKSTPEDSEALKLHFPDILLKLTELNFQTVDGTPVTKLSGGRLKASADFKNTQSPETGDDTYPWKAQGDLTLESATIGPFLQVEKISSPFTYQQGVLNLPQISASSYTGALEASLEVGQKETTGHPNFTVSLKLSEINVEKVLSSFKNPEDFTGELRLELSVKGSVHRPLDGEGRGSFKIKDAQLKRLQKLKILGVLLGIRPLKDGHFDSISSDFTVRDRKINFENLSAHSKGLHFTGQGSLTLEQELDLSGSIIADLSTAKRIEKWVGEELIPEEAEEVIIPVTVKGPIEKPEVHVAGKKLPNKVNFGTLLEGLQEGSVIDGIRSLFGN